ncbi:hypothetical protein [Aeromonas caviae]|uniref:hypothetical protein n=1 Tax=Aeromonas caviae TaxID=648 RepID=UPI0029D80D2B|nr:hypothetical protein [Aeromonas caviae]MDX7850494.1 hypothetical protein [Aeromonas caviae]
MDDGKGKPSKIPKKAKLIFGFVALAVMGGGYLWLKEPNVEPEINPNPTELFTIHGEFPFDQGYKLVVSTKYESSNPECRETAYVFGIIPAATHDRLQHIDTEVIRDKNKPNRFTAIIYKDQYLLGHCGWKMIYAYYFIVQAGSPLDKRLLADPGRTYRAGATVFSQSSMGWAEIRMGNININCKQDKHIDGAVDCENKNQQMLDRLSIQDRAELKKITPPSLANVKFVIQEQ